MIPVQMVDLKGQYEKIKEELDQALAEVFEKCAFIQGPQVRKFESELSAFINTAHCISCGNGTDALQIALMALELKPGDEVIVPAFTYVATAEAAALLGIKIIPADVNPATFNISPQSIGKAITSRTKAVVPVHLFGQCAEMEEILALAEQHGLYVIEDAAQALGARYTFKSGRSGFAGTLGTIGITSFFPSKNLGCYGDGGALFTNDQELAKKIRMIANHGQEKKYYHERIGVNSRLDTLQAAILLVKLKHFPAYIRARQEAAAYYDKLFEGNNYFRIPFRDPASTHVFHQYTIQLEDDRRDALKKHLESAGIPSMIYYPEPVHLQRAYESAEYGRGAFPVAEALAGKVLSLPMHTELNVEQLNYIGEATLRFFN